MVAPPYDAWTDGVFSCAICPMNVPEGPSLLRWSALGGKGSHLPRWSLSSAGIALKAELPKH